MPSKFVPKSWQLTPKLRQFALDKGLTDKQIDDQLERFRDCEFPKPRQDFDRCWRRWIRNGIDWGSIHIAQTYEQRQPEQITAEQRAKDIEAFNADMRRLKVVK